MPYRTIDSVSKRIKQEKEKTISNSFSNLKPSRGIKGFALKPRFKKQHLQKLSSAYLMMLMIFQSLAGVFMYVPKGNEVKGADYTWDFSNLSDYNFDNTKVEFSSEQVQLKALSWYDARWHYRKKIIINHDKVAADLTNFPVLVKLDSSNFDFSKSRSDGFDIRFTDSDGATLTYERERHDAVNQVAEYWVKLPLISSSVDTELYIYYTNLLDNAREEVFLDSANVESSTGISFQVNRPVKYADNPIFGDASWTWDRDLGYVHVLSDDSWPSESKYRMWYVATKNATSVPELNYYVAYAYSSDGINWIKPNIGLFDFNGSTENNIIINRDQTGVSSVVYDPDGHADQKYVLLTSTMPDGSGGILSSNEIWTAPSPTGPFTLQKSLPTWQSVAGKPGHGMGLVKRNDGRWISYYQYWTGSLRYIGAYVSDTADIGASWTDLGVLILGASQRHSIEIYKQNGFYYAFVSIGDQVGPTILYVSRDGINFTEKDSAWLSMGGAGSWDSLQLGDGNITRVGNEWWYYYPGASSHTTVPWNRYVGIAKIGYQRIGGITGVGSLVTAPISPSAGGTLLLNANADGGKVEAELLDSQTNTIIPGYSKDDFDDITADAYSAEATWGGKPLLTGRNIKIKFYVDLATLYAYQIGVLSDHAVSDVSTSAVWDSSYKMVQHLEEFSGGTLVSDSTSNSINGSRLGTTPPSQIETGKIGRALSFNGSTGYVDFGDTTVMDESSAITVSAWINSSANANQFIFGKAYNLGTVSLAISAANSYKASFQVYNGAADQYALSDTAVNDGSWHYLVGTWDGSILNLYIDGVLQSAPTSLSGAIPNTTDRLSLGSALSSTSNKASYFNGLIDEAEIALTTKSADSILTNYNNQNSPSSFYALTAEENSEEAYYSTHNPSISLASNNSQTFCSVFSGFTETATKNGGEIKYLLSNDAGTNWIYYNGSSWVISDGTYSQSNTASEINSNISAFPIGGGKFLWRAFLHSNGVQQVALSRVEVDSSEGPSFISPAKPAITNINITASDNTLSLTNLPDTITQIAVSTSPDFTKASWEDISKKEELLQQYANEKEIYIKFRTNEGGVSDIITYNPQTDNSQNNNTNPGNTNTITIEDGDIVKTPDSPDIYVIKIQNNREYKRLILSPKVFNSYQHLKWENVKTISEDELNQYQTSNLVKEALNNITYAFTAQGDRGQRKPFDIKQTYDPDSIYAINKTERDSYEWEE